MKTMVSCKEYWQQQWKQIPLTNTDCLKKCACDGLHEWKWANRGHDNTLNLTPSYLRFHPNPKNKGLLRELCRDSSCSPNQLFRFLMRKSNCPCKLPDPHRRFARLPKIPFSTHPKMQNYIFSQYDDFQYWMDDWMADIIVDKLFRTPSCSCKKEKLLTTSFLKDLYKLYNSVVSPLPSRIYCRKVRIKDENCKKLSDNPYDDPEADPFKCAPNKYLKLRRRKGKANKKNGKKKQKPPDDNDDVDDSKRKKDDSSKGNATTFNNLKQLNSLTEKTQHKMGSKVGFKESTLRKSTTSQQHISETLFTRPKNASNITPAAKNNPKLNLQLQPPSGFERRDTSSPTGYKKIVSKTS